MKTLIWGAGAYGKRLVQLFEQKSESVVGFADNNFQEDYIEVNNKKYRVYKPDNLEALAIDRIVISNKSQEAIDSIRKQLREKFPQVDVEVMMDNTQMYYDMLTKTNAYSEENKRISFIKGFASYVRECKMPGAVAECGVYQGDSAQYINKFFRERRLYLFDTFEGFSDEDLSVEHSLENVDFEKGRFSKEGVMVVPNIDLLSVVKEKMHNAENCIYKAGYFPDTAIGIDEKFCFVNLDMDLYQPMYAGIDFFYDKMVQNGMILLHDYYHPELPGVKEAVINMEKKLGKKFIKLPIGDGNSLAIIKV